MLYFSLRLQELDAFKSIRISALLHILTCQQEDFHFAKSDSGLQEHSNKPLAQPGDMANMLSSLLS